MSAEAEPVRWKRCPDCGHDRPASDFGAHPSRYDGLASYCLVHQRERSMARARALRRGERRKLIAALAAITPPLEMPECEVCEPSWSAAAGFAHDPACPVRGHPLRSTARALAARNGRA